MSSGTFYDGPLTGGGPLYANPMRIAASTEGYELRTSEQHIASLERDIARMHQQIADMGMMIAQLRECITGEPPFLQPAGDWSLNE